MVIFFRRSHLRAQPLRSCSHKSKLLSQSQDCKSNQDPTTSICSDKLMFECVCVKWWDGSQKSAGKHFSWSSWEVGFQCAATGLKGKSLSVLLQAPSASLPATFLFHSFSLGALCLPFSAAAGTYTDEFLARGLELKMKQVEAREILDQSRWNEFLSALCPQLGDISSEVYPSVTFICSINHESIWANQVLLRGLFSGNEPLRNPSGRHFS